MSKYLNIAAGILALLLVGTGIWYVHHKGFESGAASRQHEVDTAKDRADNAERDLKTCGQALAQANAATAAAQHAAQVQRDMAQAAVEAATSKSKASQVRFDAWTRKYIDAKTNADCKTQLEQTLCPAVSGY